MTHEERDRDFDIVFNGVVNDGAPPTSTPPLDPATGLKYANYDERTAQWYLRVVGEGRDPTLARPHSLKLLEKAKAYLDRYGISYREGSRWQEKQAEIDKILRESGLSLK